jgi:hypothetical protein
LEPGLVITRINKQPTGTKDQFDAVVSKLKTGDDVVFEVIDPRHPDNGINYPGRSRLADQADARFPRPHEAWPWPRLFQRHQCQELFLRRPAHTRHDTPNAIRGLCLRRRRQPLIFSLP